MFILSPILKTDGYKLFHRPQYPKNTIKVYSNWTNRKSRIPGIDHTVVFGIRYAWQHIVETFDEHFFGVPKEQVLRECKEYIEDYTGQEYDVTHIGELHDLGYLPMVIKSLPEGTLAPIKTPVITMYNTLPKFFWLTNYLETYISSIIWQPMTSATIANKYRQIFQHWADETGGNYDIIPEILNAVDIQGHDFSMRGMSGEDSFISSGMGHLTSFKGTDTIPAVVAMKYYYPAKTPTLYGTSVPATEHSVMCAGGDGEGEFETFKRLITEVHPTGVVSIVSDTWDLWKVLTDYLPRLKDVIMARDGKVVIRPDSGDPADIICGTIQPTDPDYEARVNRREEKGVVELLWDVFGGTINEKGYKMLDPHIGCIYGDSITPDRAEEICSRLADKGFASTNWVAGIGSFTYQFNTRDTFGGAMKATYVESDNGTFEQFNPEDNELIRTHSVKGKFIYKEPVTDDGTKKSARGLIRVNEDLSYTDKVDWYNEGQGMLEMIFKDGAFLQDAPGIDEIRERILTGYVTKKELV